MKNFLIDGLKESASYTRLLKNIKEELSPMMVYGLISESMGQLVYGLSRHTGRQLIFLSYEERRARNVYEDMVNLGGKNAYLFPKKELMFYNIDAHSNEEDNKRLEVLSKLAVGQNIVVCTSIEAMFDKIISKKKFKDMIRLIKLGQDLDLDNLLEFFILAGYERVAMVEAIGQFSLRGGIVD